jgi:hypothetical protein
MAAKMVSPIGDTIASTHRTTDAGYIFRRIFFLFYFSSAPLFYFSRRRHRAPPSLNSLTFCMPQEILCRT